MVIRGFRQSVATLGSTPVSPLLYGSVPVPPPRIFPGVFGGLQGRRDSGDSSGPESFSANNPDSS
ncbi:hypothetical protein WN55_08446 [Dufourea novaeangliae]|uniref:Uncharacterized protein n=1 Tax=Dufourea novaeangliae TaxID=178035 RepID=A0A154PUK6_DUFNO|nr:hypothetical protein WN55_08446 [Dufourea novaeangliae]